jgi:hypothetical protein
LEPKLIDYVGRASTPVPEIITMTASTSGSGVAEKEAECDTARTMGSGYIQTSRKQVARVKEAKLANHPQSSLYVSRVLNSPQFPKSFNNLRFKKKNEPFEQERQDYGCTDKFFVGGKGNPDDGSDEDNSESDSSRTDYNSDNESSDSDSSEEEDKRDSWRASMPDYHQETLNVLEKITKVRNPIDS